MTRDLMKTQGSSLIGCILVAAGFSGSVSVSPF